MSNRFYTIMIVPEKTSQVRKFIVPSWLLKGSAVVVGFFVMIAVVMVLDYWYVMNQINENKQLKMDNRRLKQQVQVFQNKMTTIESTMERVTTFATRLKVITNIEDRGGLLQSLNGKLPDANTNIGNSLATPVLTGHGIPHPGSQAGATLVSENVPAAGNENNGTGTAPQDSSQESSLNFPVNSPISPPMNPEDAALRREYEQLDERFTELNQETLYVEQMLQDQYELLADQKAFLAALPTRKPTIGYFTSGFGVRKSPYGGKLKMHEGLDIANRPGTLIRAPADGIVLFSDSKAGYGQTVILDHGYGLQTWYGHNKKLLVKKGQRIRRGDNIAYLGNSGRSTGPHVHYEVRVNGTPVDPLSYILEN